MPLLLKDSGGNVKAQANPAGVVVTGVLTATSFVGDGSQLEGVVSGVEVLALDTSVGTSTLLINF